MAAARSEFLKPTMAYSNANYSDGEVKFGPLIDLREDELEMAVTVPYQASSSQTPKPRATSTPATVSSNDRVLEAIARLSSGIERQQSELQRQIHELTQRVHSIELDQQHSELGTSPPADSCGGKQRSACRKTVWRAAATSFTLFRLQERPRRYAAAKPNSVKQSLWSVQRHSTALHPGRTTKHSLSSWRT